jgi:DNA-directed RNA polymerase beta' subunit
MLMTEIILDPQQIEEAHPLLSYRQDLPTLNKRLKKHDINPLCGRALFSSILPADFSYSEGKVVIKDGVLIEGRIGKGQIGQSGGNTIQMSIWKWYGRERAVAFITDCTYITDWFILQHGLTIGYDDIASNTAIRKNIDDIKRKNIGELRIKILEQGSLNPDMSIIAKETREKNIGMILSSAKTGINKIANESLSPENPLNIMANSGAKGKPENTANITGLKGQEMVFGHRPEFRISDESRCLPYFDYNSENIRARGFVSRSFLDGMTPSEMYFLSEGAREGSISTALNTGKSGDLFRKLGKTLEDFKICYDGSVRNANNTIYQLSYFDGYDAGEVINTNSISTSNLVSFINVKEAVAKINNIYG